MEMVPYEGSTCQGDKAGKMRTALLEKRTAPQNRFVLRTETILPACKKLFSSK